MLLQLAFNLKTLSSSKSYNQMALSKDKLFEMVAEVIAEPHKRNKLKAIRVFLYFDEYLMENVPAYCGGTKLGEIDFGGYAAGVLDELEGK
jgi:hypothetical protein